LRYKDNLVNYSIAYQMITNILLYNYICAVLDRVKNQRLALKIIDKRLLTDSQLLSVYKEIRILEAIRHSSLVHLIEETDTPTEIYLFFELIRPGSFDVSLLTTSFTLVLVAWLPRSLLFKVFQLHCLFLF